MAGVYNRHMSRTWLLDHARVLSFFVGGLALACGGSDPAEGDGTAGGAGSGAASNGGSGAAGNGGSGGGTAGNGGTGGGNVGADWETLLSGDWSLASGSENYQCVRKTMTEDVFIAGFDPIAPLGTHHTVLSIGDVSGPDGIEPCGPGTNNGTSLFGAGVGTNLLEFPAGVAVRISAGQQLMLNLHLFNVAADTLTGTSGVSVRRVAPEDVENEAQVMLMGPFNIAIPPMQEATVQGGCTQEGATTLFAIQPHMHQIGSHMRVVAESSIDGDIVIHDEPFDFDRQEVHLIDPVRMAAGDFVSVECTWQNPTSSFVTFGDSSTQEMCFGVVYRYPKVGQRKLICPN